MSRNGYEDNQDLQGYDVPSGQPGGGKQVSMELEHAIGFSGNLRKCLFFHPNGRDIVYAAGGCVVVADLSDPHNQVFLRGHDDNISCLTLSSNGRYIASGQSGENADVIVWDFEEKRLLYRMQSHDAGVAAIAFSHDDKLLLSVGVSADNRLFVWDMSTGLMNAQATAVPDKGAGQSTWCAGWGGFLKDVKRRDTANYAFFTAGPRMLRIWGLDPVTGTWVIAGEQLASHAHVRDYTCLVMNREWLYAGSTTGDVTCFQLKGRQMAACKPAAQGGVESLYLGPADASGRSLLLVGGGDGGITKLVADKAEMRDVRDGTVYLVGGITSMEPSADGEELIVGSNLAYIYRVRTDDMRFVVVSENHSGPVTAVAFPADSSERFATCGEDGTVRVWDLSDYRVLAKASCRDGGVPTGLAFALECIVSGWSDGKVRCFDGETGELLWVIPEVHRGGVTALKVSRNQRFIVTGGRDGDVRVWDLKSRELVSHLKEHTLQVTSVCIFDDDAHCLTGSKDKSILCWDLRQEKRVASLRQRMGAVNGVALCRDQMQVVSVGSDKRLTMWEMRYSDPLTSHDIGGEAFAVVYSNAGDMIATGGKDQLVRVWAASGAPALAQGLGHSGSIRSLAFSPDDRQLVTVGDDGGVFVWNIYS